MRTEITGLALDSRQVRSGYLFVARKGLETDGHRFIGDAVQRGAAAIAVTARESVAPESVALVAVDGSTDVLSQLAHKFYGQPSCRLIGITGTNGKTTTGYLTRYYLENAECRTGLIGTVAYEFGARSIPAKRTTPDVFELYRLLHQMTESGAEAIVMEVSSHALVQNRIGRLVFDVAAFTNLSLDHLDYHKTMEEYYAAKRRLFEQLRPGDVGIRHRAAVSLEDQWGRRLTGELDEAGVPLITYSNSDAARAAIHAENIEVSTAGCLFNLVWEGENLGRVRLPMLGRHNISNCLAAMAVAHEFGADIKAMIASSADMCAVPGRLEFISNDLGFVIAVDYAHTDDALNKTLHCLRELAPRELWVVFGCGGDRDHGKRPRMGTVVEKSAHHVVLTNDNPRTEDPAAIIADIREGMTLGKEIVQMDRREAIATAISGAQPGDIVLIAGKGHETYQEVNRVFHDFDDRTVASQIIAELEGKRVHS